MSDKLKGGVIVFIGACSFGLLSTIVKTAYGEGYNVGQITGAQAFFGMSVLWILYLVQSRFFSSKEKKAESQDKTIAIKKTAWWKVSLAGMFTGLVGIFYYKAVELVPASIAIVLLMQYLWISILLDAIIFRKKPARIQLISAGIVLFGTVFAGGIFNESLTLDPMGILFGMLSAVCYALFILTSGRVGNDLPVFKKSALMITGSFTIVSIIFPPLYFFNGVMIGGLYKWGLLLATFGTIVPPLFFSYGLPKVGVSLGSILIAAELPVAVLSSFFLLREDVQFLQWFGVAIILSAIVATNIPMGSKKNGK